MSGLDSWVWLVLRLGFKERREEETFLVVEGYFEVKIV